MKHTRIQSFTGKMGRLVSFGTFGIMVAALMPGCKHEPPEAPMDEVFQGGGGTWEEEVPCDPNTIYFQQQVLPLLVSNCAVPGCHNTATDDNDEIETVSYTHLTLPTIYSV